MNRKKLDCLKVLRVSLVAFLKLGLLQTKLAYKRLIVLFLLLNLVLNFVSNNCVKTFETEYTVAVHKYLGLFFETQIAKHYSNLVIIYYLEFNVSVKYL